MSRLPKFKGWRQRELFDRADVLAHVPRLEYFGEAERRRAARGAAEHAPVFWQGMASWVRQLASIPPSWRRSDQQERRLRQIARMLDVEKVRLCRHDDSLALVEEWLCDFRNNDLCGAFTRAEIGRLIVEVRNRRQLLALGRDKPKPKGPRMDPARLPDEALERLIQSHPDMALVEALRAERDRRSAR